MLSKQKCMLTSAALSLLLAGCGSGSDTVEEPVTKAANDSPAIQTKAPIAPTGVLGEVVATMLVQQVGRFLDIQNEGFESSEQYFPASPWSQSAAGGHPLSETQAPDVLGHQYVTYNGSDGSSISMGDHRLTTTTHVGSSNFDFHPLTISLDNTINGQWEGWLGLRMARFDKPAAGDTLLTVSDTLKASVDIKRKGVSQGVQATTMMASNPYVIRKSQRIPMNRTLQYWQGPAHYKAQLMLLQGNAADEVRLCFNVHATEVKRLTCTQWQIPADWKPGDMLIYKGLAVTDDRSAQPGYSSLLHWQTSPKLPVFEPVHSNGITGQLLTHMMRQTLEWSYPLPFDLEIPDYGPLGIGDRMYQLYYPKQLNGPMPGAAWLPEHLASESGGLEFEQNGRYSSQSHTLSMRYPDRPMVITTLNLSAPDQGHSILGARADIEYMKDADFYNYYEKRLRAQTFPLWSSSSRQIKDETILPFYRTLNEWRDRQGNHIRMLLLRDASRNDIRLCQDIHVLEIKRLVCTIWNVPANWPSTISLDYRGIYVVEDRDGTHTFWQTRGRN